MSTEDCSKCIAILNKTFRLNPETYTDIHMSTGGIEATFDTAVQLLDDAFMLLVQSDKKSDDLLCKIQRYVNKYR
jgi:hypothetical protein